MPAYLVPAAFFAWLFTRSKPAAAGTHPANDAIAIKTVGAHSWSRKTSARLGNPRNVFELFDNGQYLLSYLDPSMRVIEFASWAKPEQFDAAERDVGVHFGDP